ncbi:MAG: AraC family transcriptional regulator [Verrucomicrobiota bacterium]
MLDEFGLLYLVNGRGIFESAHQSATSIEAGSAVFLFPGDWHRYRPDPDTGWEEYWILFGGSVVESWKTEGFLRVDQPVAEIDMGHSLAPIFDELLRLSQRGNNSSFVASGLCHLLIGRILNAVETPNDRCGRQMQEAADILRLRAGMEVDLQALSIDLAMSYSAFRRAFRRHFGIPPHRFHQQARITLAKELLIGTPLPLKAIADRLSFQSEFYFMQAFKRVTGFTPTQWRLAGGRAQKINSRTMTPPPPRSSKK